MAGEQFQFDTTKALREYAPTFPETNEGDSCVKRAFRARTKGFLYLGGEGRFLQHHGEAERIDR